MDVAHGINRADLPSVQSLSLQNRSPQIHRLARIDLAVNAVEAIGPVPSWLRFGEAILGFSRVVLCGLCCWIALGATSVFAGVANWGEAPFWTPQTKETESGDGNSLTTDRKPAATTPSAQSSRKQTRFADDPPLNPKLAAVKWKGKARNLIPETGMGEWQPISFGGEGDCIFKDGLLTMESGDPMTGVHLPAKDLPQTNYEITLEARRTEGIDFFCGLTFPVNDSHCCLIVGGWSGAVVGLSNIDDEDASSNPSRRLMTLKDNRWYRFRIRVLPERIVVWIDDQCVINQSIKGKKISLRGDTLSCRPLGLCTFQTTSETRKLMLRQFEPVRQPAKSSPAPTEVDNHSKRIPSRHP